MKTSSEEISLEELINTIKKWKKHLIIFFVICFSVVFLAQTLPQRGKKIYRATSIIRITQESSLPLLLSSLNFGVQPIKINLMYESNTVKSDKNLKEALAILGWSEEKLKKLSEMIEVSFSERNNTILVSAYSPDPEEAKKVADAVAEAYVKTSHQRFEEILEESLNYLKESAQEVSEKLKKNYSEIAKLVQQTGVVDPKTQIESEIRRIKETRDRIYEIDYKISLIEKFLLEISENPQTTQNRIKDINSIFLQDGIPSGKKAVEILRNKIGDIMHIDDSLAQIYAKYVSLEEKRKEFLKRSTPNHPKIKEIDNELAKVFQDAINNIRILLAKLKLQKKELENSLKNSTSEIKNMSNYISDYMFLANNIDIMNKFFENYYMNFIQMKIAAGLWSSYSEIYKRAEIPSKPVKKTKITILLSLLFSSIASIIFAFILEGLDTKFKSIEEIKQITGIPVAGTIRRVKKIELGKEMEPLLYEDFRRLKINLQIYRNKFSAVVVSPVSGDGKTTITYGLAQVLAEAGYKTAILDLNLRHPELSKTFSLPEEKSLSKIFAENKSIEDIELKIGENLSLFGVEINNYLWETDLFLSNTLPSFIISLREKFDFLITDTTPLMMLPDSIPILKYFDIVLAVYNSQTTSKKLFKRFIDSLKEAKIKAIRIVVNNVGEGENYYYYYPSKKYYNKYYKNGKKNDKKTML